MSRSADDSVHQSAIAFQVSWREKVRSPLHRAGRFLLRDRVGRVQSTYLFGTTNNGRCLFHFHCYTDIGPRKPLYEIDVFNARIKFMRQNTGANGLERVETLIHFIISRLLSAIQGATIEWNTAMHRMPALIHLIGLVARAGEDDFC